MAIDLGRWFRDRKRQVEGVAAQVNPFDNGKTYSSVVQNTPVQTSTQVNQRSAQPPSNRTSNLINPQKPTWLDNQAFTVSSRPIAQPNFQAPKPNGSLQQEIDKSYGRGLSSLKNRLRDVVDSNTQADRIRRVAQTGLDESYQDQQARLTRDAMSRKDGDNIGAQTSGAFFKEGASFVGKSPSSIAQIQARVASSNNPLVRYGVGAVVPGAQYGLLPGGNKRGEQILRASQGINTTIDNKLQQSGLGDRADHNKWARGAGSVGFQLPALLATGPFGLAGMGSQTAADEANKAEMAGRTNEQALGIGLLQGGASMASEKFGLDRFLPGNGTAATSIKPFLGNMAKRIGTEGAQEAQQQFTQNLISNKTYNPNQGLKEGVFESAVLGGLSGGAMSGAIDLPNVTRNTNIKLSPLDESGFIDVPKQDLIIRNGDGTANSITVYHGGAGADEISRNGVKILSPDEKMKYPSSGGGYVGLSTSADKNYAQQFSQNIAGHDRVAEIKIRSDARILELPEGKMIDDMSADELTKLSKQYDVIKSTEDNEYRILNETAIASGGGKAMSVEKDPLESLKQEARKYKTAEANHGVDDRLSMEARLTSYPARIDELQRQIDSALRASRKAPTSLEAVNSEGRAQSLRKQQRALKEEQMELDDLLTERYGTTTYAETPAQHREYLLSTKNFTKTKDKPILNRLMKEYEKGYNQAHAPQVAKTDPLESLKAEARKYKTTEEFVKAIQDGKVEIPKGSPETIAKLQKELGMNFDSAYKTPDGVANMQKKVITDLYNQAHAPQVAKTDPLESLKAEARKYKTTEEFVKAQTIKLLKNEWTPYKNMQDQGAKPVTTFDRVKDSFNKDILDELKKSVSKEPVLLYRFSKKGVPDGPISSWSKDREWASDMSELPGYELRSIVAQPEDIIADIERIDPSLTDIGEVLVRDNRYDMSNINQTNVLTDLYNQAHAEANTKSSNMSDRLSESTDPADIEMRRSLSGKNRPKGAFEIEQNQQMTDEQRLQATGGDIGQTGVASDPVALARAKAKLAEAVKESRAETKKKESKALIQITPTGAKAVDTRNKNIAQGGLPKLEQSQHPQTKQSNPTQTKLANQGKAAQNGNQQSQTGQSPDTQSNHSYAKPIKNFDTKQYIIEQVNAQKVSTKPSIKNMINNFIDKSKHVFVDDAVAYERYIKDKDKRASIREGVDQVRGSSMMARQFAEDNGMNELGKMSTKDLNEFQQYLIAKRSAELEARGIKTGRNLDADQSLIKDVGNKYDTQENIIRDYSNKMLDYSVDNGLISAELRDKLITENPNYVPMNRVMDAVNENSGFKSKQLGSLSQQTVVQKIEGSERTVENPIESLLLNTERMMNESARNRVARQLASESDLTERVINDGDKVRDGYDTLSYLDNGKKVRVEVPALVAQEMRNLNSVMPDWLETSMRLAGAPTKLLRSGATSANPIFAVSNLVRDQIQTAITGKVIANVKGTPKAFVAAFSPSAKGRALRAELRRNGIVGSEYRQTYGSKSGQFMQELQTHNKLGMKAVSKLKHPIESIADVIGATEYFTRAQQFYGTDGDVIARAQAARNNSLNFSRAGVLVRQMNRVIPFLNAGVQGGRITVNTIKNRPVKAAASTATMLGVALAVKALAQAQDDELYERLRDEEKKNNLIIFKPDAHYDPDSNRVEGIVKVPMPQMLYPLLDGVNNVKGKPEDLLRVAGDIFTAVSGIDATNPISQLTPTVVKPAVEIGLNKDLYTGMDLVSDYEKNKNPEDIAAKYGTQPARKLAETTGLPAPYFDNIFKNFGGGLAKDLTLALGKNPDNKRSGKGITGMLEGGLDRRFGSAGITSQYDIQSKLAEGYKDQLRNNSTFKSLSTDDQSKVLDKVDYDTKSIAGIMAKTEQNRNSEIKKDLSDRQKDIVEKGFNPDRFMQSIESGNKGKKDKTDYYKSNDAEYNSFKKEYDDKIKNNEYTKAGKIKAENKLRKLEVGKPYSKDARDLYDINNSQLAKWLSTDEKGVDKQKLHDELIAYDQALYDAGLIKYKKFKGGVATGRNGKGGSRKGGGKSKIDIAQILSKSNLQVQHSQNLSKLLAGTTFKGTKTKPSTSKNKSKVAQKTIKVDMRA